MMKLGGKKKLTKEGTIGLTLREDYYNRLKIIAKIRKFKSVQQMIYKTFLGVSK